MNDDILISKVKQICKKKPNERTISELQELQELTKNSKVFKSLSDDNNGSAHLICCKYMIYEYCAADNYLFKAGDIGTKFYIIISGKVGVEIPLREHLIGETKNVEVVQFVKGGSFGELALENSKPRAASIKCKVNSHFLALEKNDYNRMIGKLVRDKRNNTVSFLQSLPIFINTTKGSLSKLTYNFKEKEYINGQIVYREGDESNEIYLITEGEFLFQKKIKVEDGRKKYRGDVNIYTKDSEVRKYRAKGLYKNLIQTGDIAKLGVGELFGIEEEGEWRKYSCICNSNKASLLCITKADFFKRIKEEDIIEYIKHRNQLKEKDFNCREVMWKLIAEENASSLSPIQLRRRDKEIERILQVEKKPIKLEKSSTTPIFSRRVITQSNDYLHKALDQELKQSGFQLYSKKHTGSSPITLNNNHSRSISSQKIIRLEQSLKKNGRSITPIIQKEIKLGVATFSMNSKHIFEALKYQ